MEIKNEVFQGVFIKESKNRFLCIVNINGVPEECYVPSSSKMENYLNLTGKTVFLTRNQNKNGRTKFALFAVRYYGKLVLLNLNLISSILHSGVLTEYITRKKDYQLFKEQTIYGYKTDLLLIDPKNDEDKILIEAKGIISTKRITKFPQVNSERAIRQLIKINNLLLKGVKIQYLLISLSPIVRKIVIEDSPYSKLLKECINNGLLVKGLSLCLEESLVTVSKKLIIEYT